MTSRFAASVLPDHIPHDWSISSVGDVLTGSDYGLNVPNDPDGMVRIIGMKDISNGFVGTDGLATIPGAPDDYEGSILRNEDILINRTNSPDLVGKVGIYRGSDEPCVFASYLVRLNPKKWMISPDFLNYWLNSHRAQRAIKRISTRAISQANINPTEFKKHCPILLPASLKEQQKIAAILSTWDEAIEKLEKLIAAKRHRKQGLMQRLLTGKARLAGFSKAWRVCQLREVTRESAVRNGNRLGVECVMAVNKAQGLIPMREQTIGASLERYKIVPHQGFAYNPMRLNIGSLARNSRDEVLVSPDYVVFTCREDRLAPDFLDHYRRTPEWASFVETSGNGSVRVRIYYADLASMRVKLPEVDEQHAIAAILNASDQEIRLLEAHREACQTQKRGLMQKLLTGQWRVKVEGN